MMAAQGKTEVKLHVYDVTNSASEKTNNTILHINKFFKDGIGVGGIFHSAIQVYGEEEWSFGYCESGSGVFNCQPGQNPMYTYRECIVLGETRYTQREFNRILRELRREWPGCSYDLLSRNCNHFCDSLCERLEIPKLPAWVNRFANAGDTAMEVAETTALKFRQAKNEIITASKVAYRFVMGVGAKAPGPPETPTDTNGSASPRFQGWFKNFLPSGDKPSSSSSDVPEDAREDPSQEKEKLVKGDQSQKIERSLLDS